MKVKNQSLFPLLLPAAFRTTAKVVCSSMNLLGCYVAPHQWVRGSQGHSEPHSTLTVLGHQRKRTSGQQAFIKDLLPCILMLNTMWLYKRLMYRIM